ncbi:MAG TPA: PhoD-like phosphatase, partial [Blastocatellia bacterium]|nr:PhoD-like phosphatase [Blastocatellia bacterium]
MAWISLKNTLGSKPLVLAGPILRKVTPASATVWLALKESAEVTLEVYNGDGPMDDTILRGKRRTVRIGKNLHIVAVTASPKDSGKLAPGTVYYYDLFFSTANGDKRLKNGTATNAGAYTIAWGYDEHVLPSFSMPPSVVDDVRIIQGSCRKPNATGWDALAILDDLIAASADSAIGRPHQLLLTGDQIYADEVADVLLMMLTDAAGALLDLEPLPLPDQTEILPESMFPALRTPYVKRAGLTTEDTRSHLMSFGEYLAMYLFIWSDAIWPPDTPTFQELDDYVDEKSNGTAGVSVWELGADIEEQRENVIRMESTLRKVRRALANVPTYMILDDHEVTDDWNMTGEWCEKVYGNVLGMRIVQNALLAYSLCQHWGNAPEQFDPAHSGAGARLLSMLNTAAKYRDIADNPELQRILGLHAPDKLKLQTPFAVYHDVGTRTQLPDGWVDTASLLYHYTIEAPAHQIIVTDTRSWRSLRGTKGAPNMIAESQLAVQIG